MKKRYFIIPLIILTISMIGVFLYLSLNQKEGKLKNFKLEFSNPNCTSYERHIYPDEGYDVYSRCGDIYYTDEEHIKVPLGEAIENEIITIKDITNKMNLIDKSEDNSSQVYLYNSKDKEMSDTYFRLEVCDKKDHIFFMHDKSSKYDCTPKKEKDFTITLENGRCNSKEKVIYEYNDEYKIYSRCGDIYYSDNEHTNIPLKDAIDNYYITAWDIANKMEEKDAVYDGGTIIYEYNKKKQTLSNSSFRLEICNKISGRKDQLFLSINSNNYKCA